MCIGFVSESNYTSPVELTDVYCLIRPHTFLEEKLSPMNKLEVVRFTVPMAYAPMLEIQKARHDAVVRGEKPNTLFLLEHEPVITLGRNAHDAHLLESRECIENRGVALYEADRGGDVTYHGPGQLVAYPILDLNLWQRSLNWYLRELEQVIIEQLARYGIAAHREPEYTGVWVGDGKVAAIGIGVRKWVTFHGIALNINPDMSHFGLIVPCGIQEKSVTSLEALLAADRPGLSQTAQDFTAVFCERFELEPCAPIETDDSSD